MVQCLVKTLFCFKSDTPYLSDPGPLKRFFFLCFSPGTIAQIPLKPIKGPELSSSKLLLVSASPHDAGN